MKYFITLFCCLTIIFASGQKKKVVTKNPVVDTFWKSKYETITENYYQGYSLVTLNGKHGFVNKNGIITTPLIYDYLYGNILGLSGAEIMNDKGIRLKGYIDIKSGKVIIPLIYNNAYHEKNGIFFAEKNGEVHRYNSAGKCIEGCVNKSNSQNLALSTKKAPTKSTKTNSKSKIAAVKKPAPKTANKYEECANCNGNGKCIACGGKGKLLCDNHNGYDDCDEDFWGDEGETCAETCSNCGGYDKKIVNCYTCFPFSGECDKCNGSGKQLKAK